MHDHGLTRLVSVWPRLPSHTRATILAIANDRPTADDFETIEAYVTVPRAAALVGVSPRRMRALLDAGAIDFIVPHRQRRVDARSLHRWLKRQQAGREPPLTALMEELD